MITSPRHHSQRLAPRMHRQAAASVPRNTPPPLPRGGMLTEAEAWRWEGAATERARQAKETLCTMWYINHRSLKSSSALCCDATEIQNRKKQVFLGFFKCWVYRMKLMIIHASWDTVFCSWPLLYYFFTEFYFFLFFKLISFPITVDL